MTTIHVALLEEGVDVWRPVEAEPVGEGLYCLHGPMPDDEHWQFKPGDVVRCETKELSGDHGRLAARLVAVEKLHKNW